MPRGKDAHVTFVSPSPSPLSTHKKHQPAARPLYVEPPRHRCPPPPVDDEDAEGLVHALLRVTLKLVVFHWVNSVLGAAAFTVVGCGALLSVLLAPLCCLGLVFFRLVLCIVSVLAELDVALANFVSLPEERISTQNLTRGSHASARACGETSVERLVPELNKFSQPARRATLYFVSVKALIGLLSSLVLSIAFSLPVGAISRGNLGDKFHGAVGLLVFLLATILLLGIGIPLMQSGALGDVRSDGSLQRGLNFRYRQEGATWL
ncbi:putative soluble pyridine nucleotide transhydrogenase [Phytophthora cinnamomi]|uniref:putative soluble pyridine nucleotide transhydrogenase n=1 Tax=Phytophthora cinnamomi TaxID=4785 RepID=UPI00355A6055|nr:putative soluble pyridine nucleotide transhydrogenase [Phytophthora cinnamomi]